MTQDQFLALAQAQYQALAKLKEENNFYDYEKTFDQLWLELGRQVLEESLKESERELEKKSPLLPATSLPDTEG